MGTYSSRLDNCNNLIQKFYKEHLLPLQELYPSDSSFKRDCEEFNVANKKNEEAMLFRACLSGFSDLENYSIDSLNSKYENNNVSLDPASDYINH